MVGGSASLSLSFEQAVSDRYDIIARQRLKIKKCDAFFIIDLFLTKIIHVGRNTLVIEG
jgi:hypothetical protein